MRAYSRNEILLKDVMSPGEIARELGITIDRVSRAIKNLEIVEDRRLGFIRCFGPCKIKKIKDSFLKDGIT